MPGFYDRTNSPLPLDPTDLTPPVAEEAAVVAGEPDVTPESAPLPPNPFGAVLGGEANPPTSGIFTTFVEAGPVSRETAMAPSGTLAEEAGASMTDADRMVASEIDAKLSRWERDHRTNSGSMPTVEQTRAELANLVTKERGRLGAPDETVAAYILGMKEGLFGFETLLSNPRVSDILLNDWDMLFVEEGGELRRRKSPLRSRADLDALVNRITTRAGGSPDLTNPIYDDQFPYDTPDGIVNVRVNVNLGSLTVSGAPTLSLRKPVAGGFDQLDSWAKARGDDPEPPISPQAVEFLRLAALGRANILIVGGTGSGKTSLMKALLRAVRREERVVVVEEANELDLRGQLENYVGLIANDQPNQKLSHLIRSAMRMRPDRIVVGECRDGSEVGGFLRAINTGHAGSFTTVHASSAKDGLQAMLTLAAMDAGSKSPVEHVGRLIHPGIDLVIYLAASYLPGPDGVLRRTRRVVEIATINEFRVVDGVPDFILQHPFERAVGSGGVAKMRSIDAPLRNNGYSGLSDFFISRMRTQGVDEQALRAVIEGAR